MKITKLRSRFANITTTFALLLLVMLIFKSFENINNISPTKKEPNHNVDVIQEKIYNMDGNIDHIFDYDSKTNQKIKLTAFNEREECVWYIIEYDLQTANKIKHTVFGNDGNILNIKKYDPHTQNLIKEISFAEGTSNILYMYEYDAKGGNIIKENHHNSQNGKIEYILEYDPQTQNKIKHTKYFPNGNIDYINKYDTKTEIRIWFAKYKYQNKNNVKEIYNYDPNSGDIIKNNGN
ncbi:DUF2963 domain-containing protein [Candidatus Phytoplasma tritici]|uniref:DUF2963 domain-containing protein n=1 Tax=Candidatus Phytoplasma tritici TaxID=321961 RepID=UPI000415B8CE|nr:DUF2963 domain-containing protein [Candidatus Phytoplasma tritici]